MIKSNATFKDIGRTLENADSVLLVSHVNPDGDAVGCCGALCRLLRRMGKECWILLEEPLPEYVSFITGDRARHLPEDMNEKAESEVEPGRDPYGPMETMDLDVIRQPDVSMCLDCSAVKRFPKREAAFRAGKKTLSIDHHHAEDCQWDQYYIDPTAPAAAQLVWQLFRDMEWPMDRCIAEALYTGISTDTGSFQYSNVTPQTFRIAAELLEEGVDINSVSVNMYQNIDPKNIAVKTIGMQHMELVADGRGAVSGISIAEMEEIEAEMEHTEDFVEDMRAIRGVEISSFLRETTAGVRVSLRSKNEANVAQIAMKFGGGGHTKAAGCTIHEPLEKAIALIREEIILTLT